MSGFFLDFFETLRVEFRDWSTEKLEPRKTISDAFIQSLQWNMRKTKNDEPSKCAILFYITEVLFKSMFVDFRYDSFRIVE